MKIELVCDTPETRAAEQVLQRLLQSYDLGRFIFTRHIRIEPGVIPHSHPVLTLNTASTGEPERYLAGFLHEQMHWLVSGREADMYRAVADFIDLYPEVPVGGSESAHNRFSVYLHFIVNWLELHALGHCIGMQPACAILASHPYYRWIYRTLLVDEHKIGVVNRRYGFDVMK